MSLEGDTLDDVDGGALPTAVSARPAEALDEVAGGADATARE
jgi:hypothetical protein